MFEEGDVKIKTRNRFLHLLEAKLSSLHVIHYIDVVVLYKNKSFIYNLRNGLKWVEVKG